MKTFVCDHCKQEVETDWTDAEAEVEALANFGHVPEGEDRARVCDKCYDLIISWMNQGLFGLSKP